jgi:hypothetical protein
VASLPPVDQCLLHEHPTGADILGRDCLKCALIERFAALGKQAVRLAQPRTV